jgi:hypothetical protein
VTKESPRPTLADLVRLAEKVVEEREIKLFEEATGRTVTSRATAALPLAETLLHHPTAVKRRSMGGHATRREFKNYHAICGLFCVFSEHHAWW